MYSFLFAVGAGGGSAEDVERRLRRVGEDLVAHVPTPGVPLACSVRALPELSGGWAAVGPARRPREPLLHELVDDAFAVLCFGDLADGGDPARAVLEAFRRGGSAAAMTIDGSPWNLSW